MKLLLVTAAAMAISAGNAFAATVDVDFENVSGFFNTDFTSADIGGIVFDRDVQVLSAAAAAGGPGQSGNVARQAQPPFGGFPRGGTVGGSFDGFTVSTLSLVVGDSGGDLDNFELLGFDAGGTQIAASGNVASAAATTLSISGTGIASFLLEISDNVPSNGGSSVFDNISFDTEVAAVPLPASLPLVGFGLIALGAATRRRKS